jgi:hypothetical protein
MAAIDTTSERTIGVRQQRPAGVTQEPLAQEGDAFYNVPPTLREHVAVDSLPFYRPRRGHELTSTTMYAIRCNENYVDVKAAYEGERAYVRNAILRANGLWFYRAAGRQPIIIATNFEDKPIKSGGRAMEAAIGRTVFVVPAKRGIRIDIELQTADEPYRIIGTTPAIEEFIRDGPPRFHATVKPHHVEGLSICTAFLQPEDVAPATYGYLMFERLANIVSSNRSDCQLTLRNPEAAGNDAFAIAELLQNFGATVTLRTHNVLRATLSTDVNVDTVNQLTAILPTGWRIFTDTPLNVWAGSRSQGQNPRPAKQKTTTHKNHKQQEPEVVAQQQQGNIVVKIAADYPVHYMTFEAIAASMDASILKICTTKFSDVPLAALLVFPPDAAESIDSLCQEPFSIDEAGLWYATRVTRRQNQQ